MPLRFRIKSAQVKTTIGKHVDRDSDDLVPSGALLDSWTARGWEDGLLISQLPAFEHLIIRTRHSTYEMVVTAPDCAEVMVRGGAFFPEFTKVRVAGSSLGGSFLKLHGIYLGFRMELAERGRMIVTSPVQMVQHGDGVQTQLM
jgi:hypothetical protein